MLTLYRKPESREGADIATKLQDMVLAHKVVDVTDERQAPREIGQHHLPVLADGEHIAAGADAIAKHLEWMSAYKEQWDLFQTDTCYCDAEGNIIESCYDGQPVSNNPPVC